MTAAAPGWGSAYLTSMPAQELDPPERVLTRYAFALDQHDLEALEEVLTEDAVWRFTIAGETEVGPVVGRPAILDFVRQNLTQQTFQSRHNLVNVLVRHSEADTVEAQAYLIQTSNAGGRSSLITTGFYRFRLRRTVDGWRIADLFLGMDNAQG